MLLLVLPVSVLLVVALSSAWATVLRMHGESAPRWADQVCVSGEPL
jgi:hypothetical protein